MRYLIFLLLLIISCSKEHNDPESVLTRFVQLRFKKILSQNEIRDHLSGKVFDTFRKYSDDDLLKLFKPELKYRGIKIVHKNCTTSECFLTYIIKYQKIKNHKTILNAETKKVAQMNKINDKWKISDVNNIKTYYQSKKEILINAVKAK